jgi:hypothetical protein
MRSDATKLDDLPLDLIGECIASHYVDTFIDVCERAFKRRKAKRVK